MLTIDPAISWTIALSVATLFGLSVAHKLGDWRAFRDVVRNYELLPDALVTPTAGVLVALELGAVALVLLVPTRPIGAALSSGLLIVYAAAIAINLRRGRVNLDCGCAGIGRRQPVRWWMVGRNLLIAIAALAATLPLLPRALTALDALTILGSTLSFALLYMAQTLLSTMRRPALR